MAIGDCHDGDGDGNSDHGGGRGRLDLSRQMPRMYFFAPATTNN